MDGYIKNKKEVIKLMRKAVFCKYAVTMLIVILIPVWLLAIVTNQPPEKWTQTEIVFSHISREQIGFQRGRSYVLNTKNAEQYVVNLIDADIEDLKHYLVAGNTYCLVYSHSIAGYNYMEALSDENAVFQDLEHAVSRWESEQQEAVVAIIVTIAIELIALILIDRLWCKNEYAQIRKLKADIARREERLRDRKNAQ